MLQRDASESVAWTGRRALEGRRKNRGAGYKADAPQGPGREEAQRRDEANKENRQHREPCAVVNAMSMRNQKQQKRRADRYYGDQEKYPAMPIQAH